MLPASLPCGIEGRLGILLGNKTTADSTKTLTHTLWALLNTIPAGDAQRPHRHNSVALDLCVSAEVGDKVYAVVPRFYGDGLPHLDEMTVVDLGNEEVTP